MLRTVAKHKKRAPTKNARFAIVASKYNRRYVDGMLRAAKAALTRAGAGRVDVLRVPGAFEIPVIAAQLASDAKRPISAILCLGVILRGETTHAQHIGEAVSQALAQIQITYHVPVVHEVLLLESEEQARVRCLSKTHNRGEEAAHTAMEMAATMTRLRPSL